MVEADGVMCLALVGSHEGALPGFVRLLKSSSMFDSRSSIKSIFFSL